jgi:hypothetical protein
MNYDEIVPLDLPPGVPRTIEIDWDDFDKLCLMHATLEEVAGWFQCSPATIETRVKEQYGCTFGERWQLRAAGGKASLRRRQFEKALDGNPSLLIFLGKQYLGQSDKSELSGPGGRPIPVASISVSATPEEAATAYSQMIKGIE